MYRTLSAEKISATAIRLHDRVAERFPESGLAGVARELRSVVDEARTRCLSFRRPNVWLRSTSILLLVLGVTGLAVVVSQVKLTGQEWHVENFIAEVEAGIATLVYIAIAIAFLVTAENRLKRRRALDAIHELRAMAHIIDMHQLTKDPEPILQTGSPTQSSPARTMTPFELSRYFDYCTEMLSILSKVAALYVQEFTDPVALTAVDEVETLTTGLSRKIWQKIMIIDRFATSGTAEERPTLT